MRFAALIVLALIGIGVIACADKAGSTAAAPPKWVSGASDYPSSRYITGIGSGITRDIAADRARNDLAKTISVSVESAERSKTSSALKGEFESAFSSAVNVRVSQTVGGVEIAERYYDETNKIYYALAVLDRAKNAMRLGAELSQKELEVGVLLNEANVESDPLNKVKALSLANRLLNERREIAAILAVIDAMPPSAYKGQSDILASRRAALRSVKFSVGGDYEGKKLLSEAISAIGFTLTEQDKSDYQAIGYFKNDVRAENGWQWARAVLETEIVDYEYGTTRRAFILEVKESSQTAQTAQARALEALRNNLAERLLDAIVAEVGD
ncbi:MAG: LPP20 family lipoprotein [Helicobacteraceae bacterium]|jgi:hypothetical protein|nr:LPP20 family lipoprotein [Helicobacteraceae bacterium]